MIEALTAIALLCSINGASTPAQKMCQSKWYECISPKVGVIPIPQGMKECADKFLLGH